MADDFNWDIQTFSGNQAMIEEMLEDDVATTDPNEVTPKTDEEPPKKDPPKKEPEIEDEPEKKDILDDLEETDEEDEDKTSKKEKTPKATETEDETNEEDEDGNPYSSLSQDLIKLGVFEDDEEAGIPEDGQSFLDRFNLESQKRAQYALDAYLGRFGEDRRELFDAIFNKNVDPKEYLQAYANVETYSELDMEKPTNQEKVVRASLKNQGWDAEDIEEEVEKLKEYGDLERASKVYHKAIVKNETKRLQEQAAAAEARMAQAVQNERQYQAAVDAIISDKLKTKHFDGIPLTPAVAEKLRKDLIVKAYKSRDGQELTEFDKFLIDLQRPENFPLKVKIALLQAHGFDLTKVANKIKSEETDELFNSVAKQKKTSVKKGSSPKTEKENDLFASVLGLK